MKPMIKILSRSLLASAVAASLVACSAESESRSSTSAQGVPASTEATESSARNQPEAQGGERYAYFGDLHVHTTNSMDAFQFGTLATPDDAYRYAQGEAIKHPGGFDMQLKRPLDFYAVTDHGFYLGVVRAGADTTTEISKYPSMQRIHNLNAPENLNLESIPTRQFRAFIREFRKDSAASEPLNAEVQRIMSTTWQDEVRAADQHYKPGKFTTFAAYEFSTTRQDGGSLHRNVIFRGTENLPGVPFNRSCPWIQKTFGIGWTACVTRALRAWRSRTTRISPMDRCLRWPHGPGIR